MGRIPPDAPLVPLLEDLQRLQKKLKLKPEALESEISLDLRSAAGLGKSVLLHRLNILGVPWGRQQDAVRSRGTFRERWMIRWEPEFAVRLVENLVYGSTIEQSAEKKISEALAQESNLSRLAESVQLCLEAQLNRAAEIGLKRLDRRVAHAGDCIELLESIPPLINIHRYGTAREMSFAHVGELIDRLVVQTALSLPYACRNLNDEEAQHYRECLSRAHEAVELAQMSAAILENWWAALNAIVSSGQSSLHLSGLCARLLYQTDRISHEKLQILLQKMLSPALQAADAARFFDGFFRDSVQRLLYDPLLLAAVQKWLFSLEEASFVEFLPLFRRIFCELDSVERKHMLAAALEGGNVGPGRRKINPSMLPVWSDHLECMGRLFKREKNWSR